MLKTVRIFKIIGLVFLFTGCFKKEIPPQEWTDWVKKGQDRYAEKISVPAAIQHLYISLSEGEFYLSKSEGDGYKLVKISSYDTDVKYEIDFEKEELLSDGKKVSAKEVISLPGDRISLKTIFYKEPDNIKARVFLYDQQTKDLDKKRERKFFPYSSKYKKTAKYKKLETFEVKKFGRSDGTTRDFNKMGELEISEGSTLSVYADPASTEKKVMLMFKDGTSGSSSYGAGRYVVIDLPDQPSKIESGAEVVIDFNYTFNPPCAVSKGFHCPLAQDTLSMKVKAGEKYSL